MLLYVLISKEDLKKKNCKVNRWTLSDLNNGLGELVSCYLDEITTSLRDNISSLSSLVMGSAVLCTWISKYRL